MKRLIKKSLMNPEVFKGSLDQLGKQGREILKLIEEYKFKLEQTCRLTANDQMLTQKLIQKKKQLDAESGQIYSIVFDVENIDITQAFEQQQINTNPAGPSNPTNPAETPGQNQQPPQNPAPQNTPVPNPEQENKQDENTDESEVNDNEEENAENSNEEDNNKEEPKEDDK